MKRDLYWDSHKFVLIFLVVLAHCVASYRPSGGINQPIYNFLFTFTMPLFIFISGMFSQINDREKYKSGILRIIETYIIFQIIMVGMKLIPGLIYNTATLKSVVVTILTPQFGLWYLLSLTFWRLMVLYIPQRSVDDFLPFELFLARGIFITCAFIIGCMVLRLMLAKITIFPQWGRITLFIYAYHLFIISQLRCLIKQNIFPQNEWLLLILSIFITMGLVNLSRFKFLNVLLNPISYITKR